MKATANHMRRNEIVGECCLQTGHCRSLPGFFSLYSPPRPQEKKIHLSATFSPLSLSRLSRRAQITLFTKLQYTLAVASQLLCTTLEPQIY